MTRDRRGLAVLVESKALRVELSNKVWALEEAVDHLHDVLDHATPAERRRRPIRLHSTHVTLEP